MVEKGTIRNMTFFGETPGTGKTSMAEAIGRELFGGDYVHCVFEFNASDNSRIEFVRGDLKEMLSYANIAGFPFKWFIIDEADGWGPKSQQAMRRLIEDHLRTARFCLIANKLNKIIPPLQSRCPPVFFAPLPVRDMVTRLQYIADRENVKYEDGVLHRIAQYSSGSMREAISTLDILHFKRRKVMIKDIETGDIGISKIIDMYNEAKEGKFITAKNKAIEIMKEFGLSTESIVSKLEVVVSRDESIKPLQKAMIISELAHKSLALTTSPSELLQLSGLLADISLVMKNGGKGTRG